MCCVPKQSEALLLLGKRLLTPVPVHPRRSRERQILQNSKPGFDFWQFHFCMIFFLFVFPRLLRLEQSCLRICGTKPSLFSISVPPPPRGGAVGMRCATFSCPLCTPLLSKGISWDRAAQIDTAARDGWQAGSASNTRAGTHGAHGNGSASAAAPSWIFSAYFLSPKASCRSGGGCVVFL